MRHLLASLALLATAGAVQADPVAELRDSGLVSEREARMILGAPTAYATYRTSYWQVRHRLRREELAYVSHARRVSQTVEQEVEVERIHSSERPAADEAQTFPLEAD